MATGKQEAQINSGQMPSVQFQNGASENEQDIYSSVRLINGNTDPAVDNSSDRKNEVSNDSVDDQLFDFAVPSGIFSEDNFRCNDSPSNQNNGRIDQMETGLQNSESGILGSVPAGGISSAEIPDLDNRNDCEVKNEELVHSKSVVVQEPVLGNGWIYDGGFIRQDIPEIAFSVRLASSANQASFDAGKLALPHVQNDQEKQSIATCAKTPELEPKQDTLTGRELTAWAIENYAVDPVKSSKNRWKIRIRCRKQNCEHLGHLKIKTVSLISDSAFKKLTRSGRKYELWKKATIAENARALRKSD